MRPVGKILLPHGREIHVYPDPCYNPDITGDGTVRPTATSYETGMEWNVKAQRHTQEAMTFTQDYAKCTLKPKGNKVIVFSLADTHWGHNDTDYEALDRYFQLIETTPDAYVVIGWNLLDAAIPAQFPDGVMWSGMTAQEQVYTFRDKLFRLYQMNKLLGGIGMGSCHEGWMNRKNGWMVYRELFDGMDKVPLLVNGGYLDICLGEETYRTAHFHKYQYWSSINRTHGGERAAERTADADVIFTSHQHRAAVGQHRRFNPPFQREVGVVASGTFKLHDKFARSNFGTEGEPGGQSVILWADKHAMQVVFNPEVASELMR